MITGVQCVGMVKRLAITNSSEAHSDARSNCISHSSSWISIQNCTVDTWQGARRCKVCLLGEFVKQNPSRRCIGLICTPRKCSGVLLRCAEIWVIIHINLSEGTSGWGSVFVFAEMAWRIDAVN
jgi:hypothetical protein